MSADGEGGGSAYVFEWTGERWVQQAKLAPEEGRPGDAFGFDVDLEGDTALIGASADDNKNGDKAGAAYVYERSSDGWQRAAKLLASDGTASDNLGVSVSLDGDSALVGAVGRESERGAVYAFERSGGTWAEQASFVPDGATKRDWFGYAIDLDGDLALAGAPLSERGSLDMAGAGFVYRRSGDEWARQQTIRPDTLSEFDVFGLSASLSGSTAFFGSPFDSNDGGESAGSAYVYELSDGKWSQTTKLLGEDAEDNMGWSVEVRGDTAVVGASGDEDPNGSDAGSAYLYRRSADGWNQSTKLVAEDGDSNDRFGKSVTLNDELAVVGAPGDEDPNGEDGGAAYVFRL